MANFVIFLLQLSTVWAVIYEIGSNRSVTANDNDPSENQNQPIKTLRIRRDYTPQNITHITPNGRYRVTRVVNNSSGRIPNPQNAGNNNGRIPARRINPNTQYIRRNRAPIPMLEEPETESWMDTITRKWGSFTNSMDTANNGNQNNRNSNQNDGGWFNSLSSTWDAIASTFNTEQPSLPSRRRPIQRARQPNRVQPNRVQPNRVQPWVPVATDPLVVDPDQMSFVDYIFSNPYSTPQPLIRPDLINSSDPNITNQSTSIFPFPFLSDKLEITVNRKTILKDSYKAITANTSNPELLKKSLKITFEGERGYDLGGITKAWFTVLSKQLFDPKYGLFVYSTGEKYKAEINPDSSKRQPNHLKKFAFAGIITGMAIYHKQFLSASFSRPFLKAILRKPILLSDIKMSDAELYSQLDAVKQNNPEDLCMTFTTVETVNGKMVSRNLKPNGSNIPVTNKNKAEYIKLSIKRKYVIRVKEQMASFLSGIGMLIPLSELSRYNEKELDKKISGVSKIDLNDWKRNTVYQGYTSTSITIQHFWKALEGWNNNTRGRLLEFVTGSNRVPPSGFKYLLASDNVVKEFTIMEIGNIKALPVGHTCFNRLDLPPYPTLEMMKTKLLDALRLVKCEYCSEISGDERNGLNLHSIHLHQSCNCKVNYLVNRVCGSKNFKQKSKNSTRGATFF